MKRNGKGGANTKTGQAYERKKDLQILLSRQKGYSFVKKNKNWIDVHYFSNHIAFIFKQHGLYQFLKEKNVDWKKHISSKLLPDDALYIEEQNRIIILEYKFQECAGSVDEKLQTCDFKKKQYQKLFSQLQPRIKVEYIYVLNAHFRHKKYKDVLDYIVSVGCSYYFDNLPLKKLKLPKQS